jgi:hypothetical protein
VPRNDTGAKSNVPMLALKLSVAPRLLCQEGRDAGDGVRTGGRIRAGMHMTRA